VQQTKALREEGDSNTELQEEIFTEKIINSLFLSSTERSRDHSNEALGANSHIVN
jgi:hypothetical protein